MPPPCPAVKRPDCRAARVRLDAPLMDLERSPLALPFPEIPAMAGVTLRVARARYKQWDRCDLTYVELDEGPRIMTNIVDCDPNTIEVGQKVQVVFHDTGQGNALPRFRPA